MGGQSVVPREAACGELEQGHRVGLDDIRRSPSGVPAALTDTELHSGHRRHSDFDTAAGVAGGHQGAGGAGSPGQCRGIERTRSVSQLCTQLPQLLKVGCRHPFGHVKTLASPP